MANYPILSPTLNALVATKNDPTGQEDSSKLNDALVQTRNWICDFLAQSFHATTGKLLPGAIDVTSLSGLIRGSDANGGAQREVLQGSISDVDLRTGAVTAAKIGPLAVGTAAIADGAVTAGKLGATSVIAANLAASAVTNAAIVDGTISGLKLTDNTLTGAKIADLGVTNAKIAPTSVSGDKLATAQAGYILVGGNTVNGVVNSLDSKLLRGVITVDADGITAFSSDGLSVLPYVVIVERAAKGVSAAGASGTNIRGSAAVCPWSLQDGTSSSSAPSVILDSSGTISLGTPGRYLIRAHAPAIECNHHKLLLSVVPDANSPDVIYIFEGTTEWSNNISNYGQSRSHVLRVVDFTNCTPSKFCSIQLIHILEAVNVGAVTYACGVSGAGLSYGTSPLHEIFSQVELVKLA